ncbi:hypothetical protein [Sandaracinus amylolyticus]|uniref:Zinc-ribbon 15 domain-containing protein n=1 Tax=Sandaracinus amylolyticus TaxID=927083 RepID=A0A0F6WA09_9BACT|nr:hypothetical protein [Sandaracinus amylolyticus]AKF11158.1 hypothetical protein DB32_008307 [Sandaracinus amylolyticus]
MFFLFGQKKRAKRIAGARAITVRCPHCEKPRVFVEVELERTYTAYVMIDLWTSKDRAFGCTECGEILDADSDEAVAALAALDAPDPKALAKQRAALEAERAARAKAREAEQEQRDRDVEDELAALKKKLGRE